MLGTEASFAVVFGAMGITFEEAEYFIAEIVDAEDLTLACDLLVAHR